MSGSTTSFAEAEPLYQRALAMKEKLLGKHHPDVAMTLNNLAVFYKSQGRFNDAEPLYQRSLLIFEKTFGANHPKVATCLLNYASLLRKMNRPDKAQTLEARAKNIDQI